MGAVAVVSGRRGGGGVFALFGTLFHFGCRLRRVLSVYASVFL
jgi:hypothetical protein